MNKLKIAILVDDIKIEKYKIEILKEIKKLDFCTIARFINVPKVDKDSGWRYFLFRAFNKVDSKLFGRGAKYLNLESIKSFSDLASGDKDLDLILDLSSSNSNYKNNAKYGLWQYVYGSYPKGYREVINNDPFTEVVLQKRANGFDIGYILKSFKTVTDRKSMLKNADLISWRSHMLIVKELKNLAARGEKYFDDKIPLVDFSTKKIEKNRKFFDLQFSFSDDKKENPLTNSEMFVSIFKLLKKYTIFSLRKFFPMDRWFILYAENKNGEINTNLDEYKRYYSPSQNYFCADPFVVDEGDKTYLFFEELDYSTVKGYIKVAEYDKETKSFKEAKMALEMDYHLSYPNVFKHNGKYYMIVESIENKTIDLFKAVEFPYKWKKRKILIDKISAVDATLYFQDEKWWMFVNVVQKEDFSVNDELFIYHCKDFLKDEWIPHSQNPIVSDVKSARPAGNLIYKNDKLYRPAQDCSGIYGRKIVLNEVIVLNENEYKENKVAEVDSSFSDDLVAVHTLNHSKRLTVIDAIKSR